MNSRIHVSYRWNKGARSRRPKERPKEEERKTNTETKNEVKMHSDQFQLKWQSSGVTPIKKNLWWFSFIRFAIFAFAFCWQVFIFFLSLLSSGFAFTQNSLHAILYVHVKLQLTQQHNTTTKHFTLHTSLFTLYTIPSKKY